MGRLVRGGEIEVGGEEAGDGGPYDDRLVLLRREHPVPHRRRQLAAPPETAPGINLLIIIKLIKQRPVPPPDYVRKDL